MVNGRLVCLGSASQLKAAHGYGSLDPIGAGYGVLFYFSMFRAVFVAKP